MLSTLLEILLGVLVVFVITAFTGYFVAQEFGYMAVDRSRLRAAAAAGDQGAELALGITARTSFMLSGAQLGITVTGLVVGYVAEPLIGAGLGELLGVAGVPTAVGVAIGTVLALLFATAVQMVAGELFPKNLAIARPEPVARRLAWSTTWYLRLFGPLVRVFDAASNLLLRAARIEPVHDVEHAATPRDLEAIIDESRASGDLPAELSTLLDRVLDFADRPARAAMIPRPRVATAPADEPLAELVERMAHGHSRYPVIDHDVDDVVGVICLRDVLALPESEWSRRRARDVARPAILLPESLPLPEVLDQLRRALDEGPGDELACVVDEYGGLAGVITMEDVAEELIGEIGDEHDAARAPEPQAGDGGWTVPGSMLVDEVERLLDRDLPRGDYDTIGGLVMAELGRLPEPGDVVTVPLPAPSGGEETGASAVDMTVCSVQRRVPDLLQLRPTDLVPADHEKERS
ncbi:MAG TPA: hemolysin family protein [Pseudonocardia sp.]|nr:hemolysin family protein [Pseudonocardia sp.]